MSDVWAAGKLYEPYVGRWSRLVAREFLAWLDPPSGSDWLDVGCGTGALTQTILDTAEPRSVRGIDASDAFVAYAREHVSVARASFDVADARSLPLPDDSVDLAVSALAVNFVPEPSRAVEEMGRATRAGGAVAAYVWDYGDKMEMMRRFWDAAVAFDPAGASIEESRRFPMCTQDGMRDLWASAGLRDVVVRAIDVPTRFQDFDDYWSPFLGGQGPAPAYAMSLSPDDRNALRDRIRDSLPIAADGSIELVARAWAVRGVAV